jgi:hypothetical protein
MHCRHICNYQLINMVHAEFRMCSDSYLKLNTDHIRFYTPSDICHVPRSFHPFHMIILVIFGEGM